MNRTPPIAGNIRALTLALAIAFLLTSFGVGYWSVIVSDELSSDPFNPRLVATLRDRPRGLVVAADGTQLAVSAQRPDGFRRAYADRSLVHVVGYASFKYGSAGIEGAYAESLAGRDPADPVGRWRARYLGERTPPSSVDLGIVPAIQRAAVAALAGRRGAAIVLDPRTGAILASVSNPDYDANVLVDPAQQDLAWQQLLGDQSDPLVDRARQGRYPPGSTFKLITASAALEGGFDPKRRIRVDDPFQADPSWGNYFVRSASGAHGDFDMTAAFVRSENIYFAKVGLETGGERLTEYASRFGIGAAPPSDLPATRGQLSKSGRLDQPILVADTSFGQGELLVSPLQMALVAATVARGGSMPTPHYATAVKDQHGRPIRVVEPGASGQVIQLQTAVTIGAAMVAAVNAPGAFAAGARIPGALVAGKTGTAELASGAPHGWFIGFAPAEAATAVVAVILENTPQGGVDAAPVGGAILRAALSAR